MTGRDDHAGTRPAAWRDGWDEGGDSLFAGREPDRADDAAEYRTLTYEVTGRIARITFNRPDHGNAITADTPVELAATVERADLDPRVHVILLSGRGKGFCGGYDLGIFAENGGHTDEGPDRTTGTVLDPIVQARNHNPFGNWDPMVDYAMMSRFNRGFASLLHANKPTVAKIHGFCVAGGTDIALYCDQIVAADDTKIGYPPTRVWGVPAAGMWAHRLGDQRAKRLLLTGDCITGRQAAEWGLAVESAPAEELDASHRGPRRADRGDAGQSADDGEARAEQRAAGAGRRQLDDGQHRLRRHVPAHPRGVRVPITLGHRRIP